MSYAEEERIVNQTIISANSQYQQLKKQYCRAGMTYKSNEVLCKIAQLKCFPYTLLIETSKMFHMNQFQVIFFAHILNDEEYPYVDDPSIFETNMNLPQINQFFGKFNFDTYLQMRQLVKNDDEQEDQPVKEEEDEEFLFQWTSTELRKVWIYLLVIGYSVKYYLNESTKAYEDQMKKNLPNFFTNIFNIWVDKYSTKVLRTNPRKINQFYTELFTGQETGPGETVDLDCQYRNYNEIVEELIKATTDVDDGQHEEDRECGSD